MSLPEILPSELNPFKLTISQAIELSHRPFPLENPKDKFVLENSAPFKRLCYEELIAYQLTLLFLKRKNSANKALIIPDNKEIKQNFIKSLPFSLTNAQLRSIEEVSSDLEKDKPMLRLLHGDVGSGKPWLQSLLPFKFQLQGINV